MGRTVVTYNGLKLKRLVPPQAAEVEMVKGVADIQIKPRA